MVYFEAKSTINIGVLEEIKWYIPTPKEKALFALRPLAGFLFILSGLFFMFDGYTHWSYFFIIVGFLLFLLSLLSYPWHLKRAIKIDLDRIEETTGHREIKNVLSFLDNAIKMHNVDSGNTIEVKYAQFDRFARTDTLFVLFTKTNLHLPIDKTSITAKQDEVEFEAFIKSKCNNIKW